MTGDSIAGIKPSSGRTASWLSYFVALACLTWLAFYLPSGRDEFRLVFGDFKMKLPAITEFFLSIPNVAFPITAGLCATAATIVQVKLRPPYRAALFHMSLAALCGIAFGICHQALFLPYVRLLEGLSK